MFCATRLTTPGVRGPGIAESIMCAPRGATPPIIWCMPMSAKTTLTVCPGSELGAEQVRRE